MIAPDITPLFRRFAKWRLQKLFALHAAAVQEATLYRLLDKAKDTRFGKDHHFAAIKTVADYQKAVPLRRYEDFWREYWQDPFPILDNVTWPGRVPFFALTSGTSTGATKYIPCTWPMIRANRKAALDVFVWHTHNVPQFRPFAGKTFILGGSTDLTRLAAGVYSGDLSGIAAKTMPFWAKPYAFPNTKLALLANWEEKLERLAKASLNEPIRVLSDTPSWLVLLFENVMALRQAMDDPRPPFPELELLIHGGVSFAPYRERFSRYLKPTAAKTREVYPASEGFIGIADKGPDEGLRLMLDHGMFYEFVPLDELNAQNPRRFWLQTIEPGVDYAIVLSNHAGLWADIIGDTVRFIERQPPRFYITGRTSYMLSAFGEHLLGEEIEAAVLDTAQNLHVQVHEFCVGVQYPQQKAQGSHLYLIECEPYPKDEALRQKWAAQLAGDIDRYLQQHNDDYRAHRLGQQLDMPGVILLKPGAFVAWMRWRGALGGQNKVPRVVQDEALFQSLHSFLLKP